MTEVTETAPAETGESQDTSLTFGDEGGEDTGATDGGAESAEEGEAKEPSDTDNQKGEGDDDGKSESGEFDYASSDFNVPEGMELDDGMMGEFLDISKELKLPKESAQKLVDLYAGKAQKAMEAQIETYENTRKGWQDEVLADKEIGGEKYKESKAVMLRALTEFGSKELVDFGNQYGWSDNPEYQRFLFRIGQTLSEDQHAKGRTGNSPKPIEDRWYGSSDG